ncbi:MAG: hypothetical protein WB421_20110, partial [Terriglobales bacterium]
SAMLSTAYGEYVGNLGTFTQSGGTNNVGGTLTLDSGSGSSTYILSGSGLLSAGNEYAGYFGSGAFAQSGGTNNVVGGGLYLGYFYGSSGSYGLSGSGVLAAANEYIGYFGAAGTFNQSGGSNTAGYVSIGNSGTYQFSGGTLQVGGGLANQGVLDAMGGTAVLTVAGSAIIDLSQGSLVNTGSMTLSIGPNSLLLVPAGFNPSSAFGSYGNAGLLHSVGTPLTVLPGQGFSGNGSLADHVYCQGAIAAGPGSAVNLNGGITVSGTGGVNLGTYGTFTANDTLSGVSAGSLAAFVGYVGYFGTGTFTQSGGVNNVSYLYLGSFMGDSGGFVQTGGTNNISGSGGLYLGYYSGSSGCYNLSGSGLLLAANEYAGFSGTGAFAQSGGQNNMSGSGALYLGSNAGSSGCYNLGGSGVLSAANEYVGSAGTGTFIQASGLNAVGYLSIGSSGSYQFGGGTLQVTGGGLANQGIFDAMGGTGLLAVAGSAIVDFSQGSLVNTGSMTLSIGPDSLLLLPAGFDPLADFGSYSNAGLLHIVGSPLTILPGEGLSGNVSLTDHLYCQGALSAAPGGAINLSGGISVSGTGSASLGSSGTFTVNDAISGISGGSL